MAKGYGMDKQHMLADGRNRPDVPEGATNSRQTLWSSGSLVLQFSQLLEAFRRRPQSQRLRIIYMQIHTVQVRAHRPKHTYKQNKE